MATMEENRTDVADGGNIAFRRLGQTRITDVPPVAGTDPGPDARVGTTSSARFNILSTMVGGGCLSLPLAFQKTGNALLGPIALLVTAGVTEFCFRLLIASARSQHLPDPSRRGTDSFESISSAAFGPVANVFSKFLVTSMCFFGTVGYAVLLRDMLQPVTDAIHGRELDPGPSWANNLTMLTVVVAVTPLCTLKTLTALERFGAASMFSIVILGSVICYRSLQCNLPAGFWNPTNSSNHTSYNDTDSIGSHSGDGTAWWSFGSVDQYVAGYWDGSMGNGVVPASNDYTAFSAWPDSWKDVLDAFPLFVSCYVCHYNILPVHNELRVPSKGRVSWWLRSTVWSSTAFYMAVGVAGSAYRKCTETGRVQGNVLLDFDESDPLLLCGRLCLAVTLTLAFPMLTIPARDIIIRSWLSPKEEGDQSAPPPPPVPADRRDDARNANPSDFVPPTSPMEELREPLLAASLNGQEQPRRPQDTAGGPVDEEPAVQNGATANGHHRGHDEENGTAGVASPEAAAAAGWRREGTQNSRQFAAGEAPLYVRLSVAVVAFWSAAAVASCVRSIDVVWDLLGSSLSILLSYLIPAGSYLVLARRRERQQAGEGSSGNEGPGAESAAAMKRRLSAFMSWLLIAVMVPMMFLSTANAVYDTFFSNEE